MRLAEPDIPRRHAPEADGSGAMFDRIAPRYDLLNRLLSLGLDQRWRRRQVASVGLRGRARVLDLATGTADVAIALARAYPQASVVGLDPSAGMLAIGREKVRAAGLTARIELVIGDAQALPFGDGELDAVTVSFGVRNFPDRRRALAEMGRVTRTGGRIAILELSEPEAGLLAWPARLYVHRFVPALGALLSGAREYRYLQRSIAAFPRADTFAALMTEVGLGVNTIERLGFGAAHLFVAEPRRASSG